jgi:DNA invertase Pin-like site-specific DNA recombinase
MLDKSTHEAILRRHKEGHSTRLIARALGISRSAVRHVLSRFGAGADARRVGTDKSHVFRSESRGEATLRANGEGD